MATTELRHSPFLGERRSLSSAERIDRWLSYHRVRRELGNLTGKAVGDFGCGYDAGFLRPLMTRLRHAVLVDVALAPDLGVMPGVTAIEATLPEALDKIEDDALDVILCISVLEHLWQVEETLSRFHRILAPGGICVLNVPTWFGKRFIDVAALRLGLGLRAEMDDHKAYYDPRDLWPLLVRAGFLPHNIRCSRHKLGLNTIAVCRVDGMVRR